VGEIRRPADGDQGPERHLGLPRAFLEMPSLVVGCIWRASEYYYYYHYYHYHYHCHLSKNTTIKKRWQGQDISQQSAWTNM
jgi:hypothetical protein